MQIFNLFSIILTLVLCISASVTDCTKGKIYNTLVFPIAGIGMGCNLMQLIVYHTGSLRNYAGNILLLAAIALALFYTHTWAGGDSKLLIALAIVYPVSEYFEVNGYQETLWMLLIATFGTGFLYILVDSVVQFAMKKQPIDQKRLLHMVKNMISGYLRTLAYIMVFSHLYHYFIESHLLLPDGVYLIICILILLGVGKCEVFRDRFLLITAVLFDVGMMIMTRFIPLSLDFRYYILILSFMIIRAAAVQYNYQVIPTAFVKKGMILSRSETIYMTTSRVKGLPGISDETLASRLTEAEAESVRRWEKSRSGKNEITIVRKVPFAIYITAGVICYMIAERIL